MQQCRRKPQAAADGPQQRSRRARRASQTCQGHGARAWSNLHPHLLWAHLRRQVSHELHKRHGAPAAGTEGMSKACGDSTSVWRASRGCSGIKGHGRESVPHCCMHCIHDTVGRQTAQQPTATATAGVPSKPDKQATQGTWAVAGGRRIGRHTGRALGSCRHDRSGHPCIPSRRQQQT